MKWHAASKVVVQSPPMKVERVCGGRGSFNDWAEQPGGNVKGTTIGGGHMYRLTNGKTNVVAAIKPRKH